MTQEALRMALEALEANDQLINGTGTKGGLVYCMDGYYSDCFDVDPINKQTEEAITAIKEALAQPEQEPVKIDHRHEWFRTGEMKVGQMRCISCGTWGHEEMPQRTWVGLTADEIWDEWLEQSKPERNTHNFVVAFTRAIEAKLKQKNGYAEENT